MNRVKDNTADMLADLRARMNKGLTAAAVRLADTQRRMIVGGHGGTRSKPGQPPHSQTGRLKASLQSTTSTDLYAMAGSDVKYAKFLDLGTVRMAARPFMLLAFGRAKAGMLRDFAAAVKGGRP